MGKLNDYLSRTGWLIILSGALLVSGYSLFWLAEHWQVPMAVAIFFSASYDGVALLAANYALKAVKDGASDRWPRFLVIVFATASAWLNSQHAAIAGEPSAGSIAWAVPPVAAAVAYDLHTRNERRKARTRADATYARPAPHFGPLTWVLFPGSTINVLREIVERRRLALVNREKSALAIEPVPETKAETPRATIPRQPRPQSKPIANPPAANVISLNGTKPKLSRAESRAIREWWRAQGNQIGDRGTIHRHVLNAYFKAHPQEREGTG